MRKRAAWRRLALASAAAFATMSADGAEAVGEVDLKAAITFNLLLFVDWPPDALQSASGTLGLCISPASAPYSALRALNDHPVGELKLQVRDFPADADAGRACQALYVDGSTRGAAGVVQGRGATLIVSDDGALAPEKGMIMLRRQANRIVFDVNLRAVRSARLQLSSKLLRLAVEVHE